MNTNTINTLAVGFAAFAAWYALKPSTAAAGTTSPAQQLWNQAAAQRREVGEATAANGSYTGQLANGVGIASDFTQSYSARQGVPDSGLDILGHPDSYYSFSPSYALNA